MPHMLVSHWLCLTTGHQPDNKKWNSRTDRLNNHAQTTRPRQTRPLRSTTDPSGGFRLRLPSRGSMNGTRGAQDGGGLSKLSERRIDFVMRLRHPKKEGEAILAMVEYQGWIVTKPNYFRAKCPCGRHIKWIHLTPSDARYWRNLSKWFERQDCWKGDPK